MGRAARKRGRDSRDIEDGIFAEVLGKLGLVARDDGKRYNREDAVRGSSTKGTKRVTDAGR